MIYNRSPFSQEQESEITVGTESTKVAEGHAMLFSKKYINSTMCFYHYLKILMF